MKWTWIYMLVGGAFVVKLIESSRTIALINEAKQLKEVTKKPIMLISSNPRQGPLLGGGGVGFDVYLNPNETITWQLPYMNKAFASIVSDALEEMPYPKQAMTEWMRVADTVLVNTHSIFSPEAWLDFRHHQVFMGQQTILVNPSTNWAIAGGVGYFFYRRHKRIVDKKEALPEVEEEEEAEAISPPEERKALSPPPEIEPAPIYHPSVRISPEEFMGTHSQFRKGTINLGIGSDEALSEELKAQGVENLVFDPQNLPEEHNRQILNQLEGKPADSATLFGLDKVSDPEERQSALQVAYENVKLGGKIFVKVEEPKKYLTEVKQIFPSTKISQGLITGVKK